MALLNEPRQWPALLRVLGDPAWGADPRFATQPLRREHAAALIALLDAAFATRSLPEWRPLLDAAGLTFDAVTTTQEAAASPQARATAPSGRPPPAAGRWTARCTSPARPRRRRPRRRRPVRIPTPSWPSWAMPRRRSPGCGRPARSADQTAIGAPPAATERTIASKQATVATTSSGGRG